MAHYFQIRILRPSNNTKRSYRLSLLILQGHASLQGHTIMMSNYGISAAWVAALVGPSRVSNQQRIIMFVYFHVSYLPISLLVIFPPLHFTFLLAVRRSGLVMSPSRRPRLRGRMLDSRSFPVLSLFGRGCTQLGAALGRRMLQALIFSNLPFWHVKGK